MAPNIITLGNDKLPIKGEKNLIALPGAYEYLCRKRMYIKCHTNTKCQIYTHYLHVSYRRNRTRNNGLG